MEIPYYQVDAFSSKVFFGNPAAVCPLDSWIEEGLMQLIASENNLSETAFFVDAGDHFELRWFTPEMEIDLCGHATLASAYVLFEHLCYQGERIRFETKSGSLYVSRETGGLLAMDFPAWDPKPIPVPEKLVQSLGKRPDHFMASRRDFLAVFEDPEEVMAMKPDMRKLSKCDALCIIVTAKGKDYDFISRVFVPSGGIPEDPVTGSAHCTLVPYWAERLGKTSLHAFQASSRGGELFCEHKGKRVKIAGKAACYLRGTITV